jgi:DNA-binding response OmpR family regulator
LHVLLREAGRVVTRDHLVDSVLGRKFSPFDRSIDMHVSKVRKKLGDSDNGSDHIKTVRGVGYIFAHPRDRNLGSRPEEGEANTRGTSRGVRK